MKADLPIPAAFDAAKGMLRHETEFGVFHETRKSCHFACELVQNGTPADLALAATVLDAVLQCQETDPAHVHCGNFHWMAEDSHVEDLNAVVFCLENLIPMMLAHRRQLALELQTRVIQAIDLGLQEVRRLDVWAGYTNITALSLLALCLGGDLLEDDSLLRQGQEKLRAWIAFTAPNGHVLEYNSPTYAGVTIRALARLRDTVQNRQTALLAEIMLCRVGLSYALHLHRTTGRLAGPHARAYQPSMEAEASPEAGLFRQWLADSILPGWLQDLYDQLPDTYMVREGILHARKCAMTTFFTPSFALGSTSRSLHPQGNHVIAHHSTASPQATGIFYTRYILDDKWLGDFYHATDRSKSRNLLDEGEFLSVQHRGAILGCYAPRAGSAMFHSAKTSFIWTRQSRVRQVLVNGDTIGRYPFETRPDARITIVTDSVFFVLQPLHVSALLASPVLVLDQRAGDLVCEIHHYRADKPKRFWDLSWPGAFYKGRPACLFYLELVERSAVDTLAELDAHMAQVKFQHQVEPARTRTGFAETRMLQATAAGLAGTLSLSIDLMDFTLHSSEPVLPGMDGIQLASPVAVQSQEAFDHEASRVSFTRGNVTFCQVSPTGEWRLIQTDPASSHLEVSVGQEIHSISRPGMALVHGRPGQVTVQSADGRTA